VSNFGFVRDEALHPAVHPVVINSEFGSDDSSTIENVIFWDEDCIDIAGGLAGVEGEDHGGPAEDTDFSNDSSFTKEFVQPTQGGSNRFLG